MTQLLYMIGSTLNQSICPHGETCDTGLQNTPANAANLHILLQIIFGIFGALAVLMIVISALNFINAQGDPGKVAKARGTIIYAIVGLVVALSAEAFVTFLLGHF